MTDASTPGDLDVDSSNAGETTPPYEKPPRPPARPPRPGPYHGLTAFGWIGLAASLATMLWMMWPAFSAKLGIIDDHEIVDMIGRHSHLPVSQLPHVITTRTFEGNGRFRPVYWVLRALECAGAGHNGTLWYVDRFVLAAITVTAIYLIAVRFVAPVAAVAVCLVPFAGPQWETFIRLGPNEAYALPLLVVGVALLVRGMAAGHSPSQLWGGYLALVASALAKENFIVFPMVAPVATAVFYGLRRLRRRDYVVLGIACAVTLADIITILVVIHRYGAVYSPVRSWGNFRAWTTYALTASNTYQYFTLSTVVALVLLAAWATTRRRLYAAAALAFALLVIALPQLIFYTGNPETGRYLYPLVLTPTLAWGISLWQARSMPSPLARLLTTTVLLLTLAWPVHHALNQSHVGAQQTASGTQSFQTNLRTLENLAASNHDTTVVLQPIDSLNDGERMLSVAQYLVNTTDLQVMTLPPSQIGGGLDGFVAKQFISLSKFGKGRIVPYRKMRHCLAVLYGPSTSVCDSAILSPG